MRVSYHAAQRFLERVMGKTNCSRREIISTIEYLSDLTKNLVITSYRKNFPLPEFGNFLCIYQENTLITIIPKGGNVKKYNRPKRNKHRANLQDYLSA